MLVSVHFSKSFIHLEPATIHNRMTPPLYHPRDQSMQTAPRTASDRPGPRMIGTPLIRFMKTRQRQNEEGNGEVDV